MPGRDEDIKASRDYDARRLTPARVESGDAVLGIQEGQFTADDILVEIGELANGASGRQADRELNENIHAGRRVAAPSFTEPGAVSLQGDRA